MESTKKILLSSAENKKAETLEKSLQINLSGGARLLPESDVSGVLDAYDEYLSERSKSNKFRLVFNVKPLCSNMLFNPITEIVKDEGTEKVFCLNYSGATTSEMENDGVIPEGSVYVKTGDFRWWRPSIAISDTQLSSSKCGFVYHCGLDIFNNHIFRTSSAKRVNFNKNTEKFGFEAKEAFNTLEDMLRDSNGNDIMMRFPNVYKRSVAVKSLENMSTYKDYSYLYQKYDDLGFKLSVSSNLKEENGWYGFSNPAKLPSFMSNGENSDFEYAPINKVINSEPSCNFIDMYPTREHYSFNPIYNKFYDRLEKNWDYCLTYPSSSTTNVDCISEIRDYNGKKSYALSVLMFDEQTYDDSGLNVLTVYSVSCHGLKEGDFVNIYSNGKIVYGYSQVLHVIDKYIFQVAKTEPNISEAWLDIQDGVKVYEKNGTTLEMDSNGKPYLYVSGSSNSVYPIVVATNRCNVDDNAQDLSFKKVVNNIECKYYVRIFSKIPNFKFKDEEVNDYTLYRNGSTLIAKYSDKKHEFESHIGQTAFARTAYNDPITEIVFTDDVDLSYLRDNLGRPVSEIYLTIIKRNKGYKEWYGINDPSANLARNIRLKSKDIEFSHCFGKVNCAFLLNDYGLNGREHADVRNLVAAQTKAADASVVNTGLLNFNDTKLGDEISYDTDRSFYGDLCCYSPYECNEKSLQTVMFRFNTAQRELTQNDAALKLLGTDKSKSEGLMSVDYIFYDNYIPNTFAKKSRHVQQMYYYAFPRAEGYFYKPHYKVQAKRVSTILSESKPIIYQLGGMSDYGEKNTMYGRKKMLLIKTETTNYLTPSDKLLLYVKSTNEFYRLCIYRVETPEKFICFLQNEANEDVTDLTYIVEPENIGDFALLKKDDATPDYAEISRDGSCMFRWRNIVSNGTEDDENVIYPFTNGAFYITKGVNLYLRRQKPYTNELSFATSDYENIIYEPEGEEPSDGGLIEDTEKEIDECAILESPLLQLNL